MERLWILLVLLLAPSASTASPGLFTLNIDSSRVSAIGLGHAGDFALQLHIAYSATISGSCLFAAQPFHCAVSHFAQDSIEPWSPWTRVPSCDGCIKGTRMPFDHCKLTPHVVDVGSLVDFPRRHCGQNPISIPECFDAVEYLKPARVFAFQGTRDETAKPGNIENTVGLLSQMLTDPAQSIKLVNQLPFAHVIPNNATPYAGESAPAGYDGAGECMRHLYSNHTSQVLANNTQNSSWVRYDQTSLTEAGVGFQEDGWVYAPQACRNSRKCGLMVLPDTCNPGTTAVSQPIQQFARYAEGSGFVILHPCVGGAVNKSEYKYAQDIAKGKLDVYGQLGSDYTHQSAPHMRGVGNMIRKIMGKPIVPPSSDRRSQAQPATVPAPDVESNGHIIPVKLPTLHIDTSSVMAAGCSNTADFSHQFHVAFSSMVTGSCIFSGQPYRCAVTRFEQDYLVPKTSSTSAGMDCIGCPENTTLIYDHCKNHPHWVDVEELAHIAETADDVDDPKVHLQSARVFAFGPSHDRCYQKGSMENIASFHGRYATNRSQIKLVVDQPFPHTLPTNQTPYYNHSVGAGYDGPGECLRHVFGHVTPIAPAVPPSSPLYQNYWEPFDQMEFLSWKGYGMLPFGWVFTPPVCKTEECKLLVLPSGCFAPFTSSPFNKTGDSNDAFGRYAVVNKIVLLMPCAGGPIDKSKWPDNHENLRGMVDVYGQMGNNYATQKGGQMEPIGKMVKRLLGI